VNREPFPSLTAIDRGRWIRWWIYNSGEGAYTLGNSGRTCLTISYYISPDYIKAA